MINKKYANESREISRDEMRIQKKKIRLRLKIAKNKSRKLILSVTKFLKIKKKLERRIKAGNVDIKSTEEALAKLKHEVRGFVSEARRLHKLIDSSRKTFLKEKGKIKECLKDLVDLKKK